MPRGRQVEVPLYSKAPFANYDIVVYLGGGFFALLVAWRYLVVPFNIFDLTGLVGEHAPEGWTTQVVFIVLLGILSYTSGHLVSYLSSHFVEGFLNKVIGSFSQIVRLSTKPSEKFKEALREQINENLKANFTLPKGAFLWLVHAPLGLWYGALIQFGLFDSLDTRLPRRMMRKLDDKLKAYFPEVRPKKAKQWFRWVEYQSNYNAPIASASMYNYLVISGFMRSIAFILLGAIWLELAHFFYFAITGDAKIHDERGLLHWGAYGLVLYVGYICAITAYTKFYRRYVEEAILGFLFEIPEKPN